MEPFAGKGLPIRAAILADTCITPLPGRPIDPAGPCGM